MILRDEVALHYPAESNEFRLDTVGAVLGQFQVGLAVAARIAVAVHANRYVALKDIVIVFFHGILQPFQFSPVIA